MLLPQLTPGTTFKFPLSVKMSTNKVEKQECSIDVGPLALTLSDAKRSLAEKVDHVPYTPGGINYVQTDGEVLSGIFTGCVMSVYTCNGKRRVAHVHTGPDAGPGLDCKDLMRDLLKGGSCKSVFAFKPYDQNVDLDTFLGIAGKTPLADQGVAVFGLVTAGNTGHSIFTRKVSPHEYVVEEVKQKTFPYVFA